MPDLNTRTRAAPVGSEPLSPVRENRIDPPHQMANGRSDDPAGGAMMPLVDVGTDAESELAALAMVQQLRTQAQQLSDHLRVRQADLDRRESELQARAANLDQEQRNNRLWLKDRHDEFAEREAELQARQEQLDRRADQLQQSEHELNAVRQEASDEHQARRDSLDRREKAVREGEEQLRQRSIEISTAQAALKDAGDAHEELVRESERRLQEFNSRRTIIVEMIARFLAGNPILPARPNHVSRSEAAAFVAAQQRLLLPNSDVDQACESSLLPDEFDEIAGLLSELESRRNRIAEVETLLGRAEREVAELRQLLLADRKQFDAERQRTDRRDKELRRKDQADLDRRREALEAASQQLELRRAAVEQTRAELAAAQREALEHRIAAEEVMAQLVGAVPPAKLSQHLAQLRGRLSECYRLQQEQIVQGRQQLETLARQVTAQHDRVTAQKLQLDTWLKDRSAEIESAAALLGKRESQLDHQRELAEKQRFDWEYERQQYQHEIRRLLAELGY